MKQICEEPLEQQIKKQGDTQEAIAHGEELSSGKGSCAEDRNVAGGSQRKGRRVHNATDLEKTMERLQGMKEISRCPAQEHRC